MFRGVVLTFLRDRYREQTAAIATALLFGVAHLVSGPLNAVVSAMVGYLLYHSRRVSGGLVVPIVLHTLYDFSIFSTQTTANPDSAPDRRAGAGDGHPRPPGGARAGTQASHAAGVAGCRRRAGTRLGTDLRMNPRSDSTLRAAPTGRPGPFGNALPTSKQ